MSFHERWKVFDAWVQSVSAHISVWPWVFGVLVITMTGFGLAWAWVSPWIEPFAPFSYYVVAMVSVSLSCAVALPVLALTRMLTGWPPRPKASVAQPPSDVVDALPSGPASSLVGPMTAPRPTPPPPLFQPPSAIPGSASLRAQGGLAGDLYLFPKTGETGARPQVLLKDVKVENRVLQSGARQVVIALTVENQTASLLPACRIIVASINDGIATSNIERAIRFGEETVFSLRGEQARSGIIAFRNYKVAPEEPVKLNLSVSGNAFAQIKPITLDDHRAYTLNLRIESGVGIITRATIEVEVGTYEKLVASLSGQSSWRQSQPSTEA